MEEPLVDIPDVIDAADVGSLIDRYAPEIKPVPPGLMDMAMWSLIVAPGGILVGAFLAAFLGPLVLVWIGMVIGLVAGAAAPFWDYKRQVQHFGVMTEEKPYLLYERIAAKFRHEIEKSRKRVLGRESDWQRARDPLAEAKDEADRSVAYWTQRLTEDEGNEVAAAQLPAAEELREKFGAALEELDRRSEVLLSFFNKCEAKISVLERARTDREESLRLARLSERAEDIVVDAGDALHRIGEQFVGDALRVGHAIGALRRLQLTEAAGHAPMEKIEAVADRILESARQEQEELSKLVGAIEG